MVATKMSSGRWVDKLVHSDNGIILSDKKEPSYQATKRHKGNLNAHD